jgi:hypothetical protein
LVILVSLERRLLLLLLLLLLLSLVLVLIQPLRGHRTGKANQTLMSVDHALMHVEQVKNGLRTRHGRVYKKDDSYSMLERFEVRRGL